MSSSPTLPVELSELLEALSRPLSTADTAAGWNREAVAFAERIVHEAVHSIRSGQVPDASRHFVRWLDHQGVTGGPLLQLVARAQVALAAA